MDRQINLPIIRERGIAADADETLFPALIEWRDAKIRDLGYCLATFFNYLTKNRRGFLEVSRTPGATSTAPIITINMCRYLLSDIFPCNAMIKEEAFTVFKVPLDLAAGIKHVITQNIINKSFFGPIKASEQFTTSTGIRTVKAHIPELEIEPAVIQMIWTYVSNGMNALAFGATTDEEIRERISSAEDATLKKRNALRNYGLNDDLENSAFQAIMYIIITLTDWLETSEITEDEVIAAYKILVPQDLQKPLREVKSETLSEIIMTTAINLDLVPTEKAINLIASLLIQVQKWMERTSTDSGSMRIINRMMSLSGPL
jgi:hypothetical protein